MRCVDPYREEQEIEAGGAEHVEQRHKATPSPVSCLHDGDR